MEQIFRGVLVFVCMIFMVELNHKSLNSHKISVYVEIHISHATSVQNRLRTAKQLDSQSWIYMSNNCYSHLILYLCASNTYWYIYFYVVQFYIKVNRGGRNALLWILVTCSNRFWHL